MGLRAGDGLSPGAVRAENLDDQPPAANGVGGASTQGRMGLLGGWPATYTRGRMKPMTPELKQAMAALDAGRIEDARRLCEKMKGVPATADEALFLEGLIAFRLGRHAEAVALLERAAQIMPSSVRLHSALGLSCQAAGFWKRAADHFIQCIQLDPKSPRPFLELADMCSDTRHYEKAIGLYREALERDPKSVAGWNNLAIALRKLGRLNEAAEDYRRALDLRPEDATIHLNLSHTLLAAGRLPEGFAEFKHRWEALGLRREARPVWTGEPMPQGTLLVFAEQGLGDTIQFVRYLPLVRERVGRVILESQGPLRTLMEQSGVAHQVIGPGEPPPAHDAYVPLMHLPAIFGTTLSTIPAAIPYLKTTAQLPLPAGPAQELKVGVTWAGNRVFGNDALRSMRLPQLSLLLAMPGVRFFSLQKEVGGHDQAYFRASPLVPIMEQVKDFADTGAILEQLDLVISVDTAVAHLAGALGRPVWVLLPAPPDWRWLTNREDSPWYPTVRLFRQQEREGWNPLIPRVAAALAQFRRQARC
jgi:Flp pilus assembly protein TadD